MKVKEKTIKLNEDNSHKWWNDPGQKAMWILMSYDFETIKNMFKHFCPKAIVYSKDDYVKSNACRHIVKYLEGKWKK